MNAAAFGGWGWKHPGLARNILKCDWSVSRSGIPPDSISKRWRRDDEGKLLEEIQAATPETELSSPGLMRSLPPTSRQRRRNSLAQPVRAGNSELRTRSPGGATSNTPASLRMPDSIRDPFKLRFARDPIRAIEIEFHFLKAYILASKPQDRSPRLGRPQPSPCPYDAPVSVLDAIGSHSTNRCWVLFARESHFPDDKIYSQ
jgi:hypothetical protein